MVCRRIAAGTLSEPQAGPGYFAESQLLSLAAPGQSGGVRQRGADPGRGAGGDHPVRRYRSAGLWGTPVGKAGLCADRGRERLHRPDRSGVSLFPQHPRPGAVRDDDAVI